MFFPESQVRVWLCNRPTDMRKSYNGLVALVKNTLEEDPLSGQLFVFINRRRKLFGEESEKRLIENPDQLALGEILKDIEHPEVPETEIITYERRKKHRPDDCVTDQGLRFTEGVPVELIHIPAPEMQGEDADQYEIIDHKYTHRLAQRPGSYVILKYQRDVVRHKADQTLSTAAAPSGLFDRSFADVSFIAGLLVEKYRYHLPLYRQHQRLEASGVTVSRGTLTNLGAACWPVVTTCRP